MRKLFLLIAILFMPFVFADDFDDIDFNFIDRAFDGIKPVSNEEFNKTINQLTPQPVENTFKGRLKTFLFGRKYGVDNPPANINQEKEIDLGGEKKAISDLKNGVYYIKLVVSIIGYEGKIIPLGNYKIKEETLDNQKHLVFYQGNSEYGSLKLREYEDFDKKKDDLTYSRVDIINDDMVRIVYSTIKDTKCAYARIYKND